MKKFVLALLVSSLAVSGVALAQQSDNEEQNSPRQGMNDGRDEEWKTGRSHGWNDANDEDDGSVQRHDGILASRGQGDQGKP